MIPNVYSNVYIDFTTSSTTTTNNNNNKKYIIIKDKVRIKSLKISGNVELSTIDSSEISSSEEMIEIIKKDLSKQRTLNNDHFQLVISDEIDVRSKSEFNIKLVSRLGAVRVLNSARLAISQYTIIEHSIYTERLADFDWINAGGNFFGLASFYNTPFFKNSRVTFDTVHFFGGIMGRSSDFNITYGNFHTEFNEMATLHVHQIATFFKDSTTVIRGGLITNSDAVIQLEDLSRIYIKKSSTKSYIANLLADPNSWSIVDIIDSSCHIDKATFHGVLNLQNAQVEVGSLTAVRKESTFNEIRTMGQTSVNFYGKNLILGSIKSTRSISAEIAVEVRIFNQTTINGYCFFMNATFNVEPNTGDFISHGGLNLQRGGVNILKNAKAYFGPKPGEKETKSLIIGRPGIALEDGSQMVTHYMLIDAIIYLKDGALFSPHYTELGGALNHQSGGILKIDREENYSDNIFKVDYIKQSPASLTVVMVGPTSDFLLPFLKTNSFQMGGTLKVVITHGPFEEKQLYVVESLEELKGSHDISIQTRENTTPSYKIIKKNLHTVHISIEKFVKVVVSSNSQNQTLVAQTKQPQQPQPQQPQPQQQQPTPTISQTNDNINNNQQQQQHQKEGQNEKHDEPKKGFFGFFGITLHLPLPPPTL
eukprot:gene3653-4551_t